MALTIEAIDEQFIPVGTRDYVLVIDIGGDPDEVEPTGDLEGFNHTWDASNGQLSIRAVEVLRLVIGAKWTILATKGAETAESEIAYNVVPVVPVILDPGAQTLYKGIPFKLMNEVANVPTVVRGSGLLTGLKYEPSVVESGESAILTDGMLPADAVLTEDSFNMMQYAENEGGTDSLMVPVRISNDRPVYLFNETTRDLYQVNDDGTLAWTYDAPTGTYFTPHVTTDAVYLFNQTPDDLYKINISDGTLAWTYNAPPGPIGQQIGTETAVYLFNDTNDDLLKVNASNWKSRMDL